jgi:hypothetical protein
MQMLRFGVPILLLFFQFTFGQASGEKMIHGKIVVVSGAVEGVNIVNLVNEKSTTSDSNGDFFILAKADDLLVFTSVNLEYHRKIMEEYDLRQDILNIKMTSKTTELKEVIVNQHPEINSVSLGISPKGIKKYTPAVRRLYTATSTPGDALLNMISGRTEMLKKGIEVEKKYSLLAKIDALFDEDYYTDTLRIPADYIKGFQFYCVENLNFAEVLNTKNKTKIEFLLLPLAAKYNQILSSEK